MVRVLNFVHIHDLKIFSCVVLPIVWCLWALKTNYWGSNNSFGSQGCDSPSTLLKISSTMKGGTPSYLWPLHIQQVRCASNYCHDCLVSVKWKQSKYNVFCLLRLESYEAICWTFFYEAFPDFFFPEQNNLYHIDSSQHNLYRIDISVRCTRWWWI